VVKLEVEEEGLGPYLEDAECRSSGVDWLKLLNGGELLLRVPALGG